MVVPRGAEETMESRRTRFTRKHVDALHTLAVSWNFTEDSFALFENFFKETLRQGQYPFVMETIERDVDPTRKRTYLRELAFADGQFNYTSSDNLFTVEAKLEIIAEEFNIWAPFYSESLTDHVPFITIDGFDFEVLI